MYLIVFFFVFCMIATCSQAWVCDYWIADSHGKMMNRVVAEKGLGWSLHGAWNERGNETQCLTYDQFLVIFHEKYVEGELTHFIDASPKTDHTCCRSQWHEYHKHGCEAGISFNDWWAATKNCLTSFKPDDEYIRSCRYDKYNECNFPEEVTNKNITHTIGCVEGAPTCKYLCSEFVNSKFCSWYYNENDMYIQDVRFLVPNVYTPDPIKDAPNCYCQEAESPRKFYRSLPYEIISPLRENQISEKNVYGVDSEIVTEKINSLTTVPPVMPEEKKYFADPTDESVLKCMCPSEAENEIDVDTIKRKKRTLKWDNLSAGSLSEVQIMAGKYQIFCYNGDDIQRVRPRFPSKDKIIQVDEILEGIIRRNMAYNERFFNY